MTDLTLVIHLEHAVDEDGTANACWWAESPDVPGFSAASSSLAELRDRARPALEDLLGRSPIVWVETIAPGSGHEERDARNPVVESLVVGGPSASLRGDVA